jgi:predicted XRE-type DNA-binding protein
MRIALLIITAENCLNWAILESSMAVVRKFIEKNGLTQTRAAGFFGITQPKVSYIMNGMVEKVSSDYLVGLLAKTGGEFRYSFKQLTKRQVTDRLSA